MKISNKGFSHTLVIVVLLILGLAGMGWFVYSRQSKNNTNNELENDKYKVLINDLQNRFSTVWTDASNANKFEETKGRDTETIATISAGPEYLDARVWKSTQLSFIGFPTTDKSVVMRTLEEAGLTSLNNSEFQNEIAFCSLYDGYKEISLRCIDRKTKDDMVKSTVEAFTAYKMLEIYKRFDRNVSHSLTYSTNEDGTAVGVQIVYPVLGLGQADYMFKSNSSWELVATEGDSNKCARLSSNEFKGVFDSFVNTYNYCK